MLVGDRPATGVFEEDYFLHPSLDFEIRFPKGWRVQNSSRAVGAVSPRGDAAIYLTSDLPEGDLVEVADGFVEKLREGMRIDVTEKKTVRLGAIEGVRYQLRASQGGFSLDGRVTFFPFAGSTWRFVGINPSQAGNRYVPQILLTTRSFKPLTNEHREAIRVDRLRVVLARRGEDLARMGSRTDNAWPPAVTGLINGQLGNVLFEGGEWMKILRTEKPKFQTAQ
jgi:predicted Zn-dependent protease